MAIRICEYYIECFARRTEGFLEDVDIATLTWNDPRVKCHCVRLDRFGYVTGWMSGSTICLVQEESYDALYRATVDFKFGPSGFELGRMRFNPLASGEYNIWRTGWTIRVDSELPCDDDTLSGFRFVPLKAFRRLKLIVRLLLLSKGRYVQESPLRFCGGREVLRLSQTASVMKDVASVSNIFSFHDIIRALSGGAASARVIGAVAVTSIRRARLSSSYSPPRYRISLR